MMIITLVLICQVGGEWVQISQQHYRKPYGSTQYLPASDKVPEIYKEDVTSKNKIYANQSLPDLNWKVTDKMYPPSTVYVSRVQINNDHANEHIYQENDKSSSTTLFTKRRNYDKNSKVQKLGFISEEIEDDVFNLNNFKFSHVTKENDETHLFNSEDTTAGKYQKFNKFERIDSHGYKHYHPSVTESAQSEDVVEGSYHVLPKIGNVKRVQLDSRTVRTPTTKIKPEGDNTVKLSESEDNRNTKIINRTITEATNENKVVNDANKTKTIKEFQKYMGIDFRTEHANYGNSEETLKIHQIKNINDETPLFVTKDEPTDDDLEATVSSETITTVNKDGTNNPLWKDTPKVPTRTENTPDGLGNDEPKDSITKENKVNTMENIVKFLKTVADTISRNTRRSVNSKVRYLENLQDTIMATIKQRIDTTWPDDAAEAGDARRRAARAAPPAARGHVEFPSSESALMTISFLTFAVYLIKLILQVIHAYKNKAVMVSPAMVAAVARAASTARRPPPPA